jgi:hypothetical protein
VSFVTASEKLIHTVNQQRLSLLTTEKPGVIGLLGSPIAPGWFPGKWIGNKTATISING